MKIAKHPAETVEQVRELRILGARTKELCEVFGLARSTVISMVQGLPAPARRDSISQETIAKLREMYVCDVPIKTIAKLLDVCKKTVMHHVRDLPRRCSAATIAKISRARRPKL